MELAGKRVVVVGAGQTGVHVAQFCARRGAQVLVSDAKERAQVSAANPFFAVQAEGSVGRGRVEFELGGHQTRSFTQADLVVLSPGVPELAHTRAARAAGVPVIAEIELAYRFLHPQATLLAITGTNGKSTTTALTGALCAASGRPTFCGGNLGNQPLIAAPDHPANVAGGLIVAEVAAFMLDMCTNFRPKVAVLTNITEDHLDRFGTMNVYARMKHRIFQWQSASDWGIWNADDPQSREGIKAAPSQLLAFSRRRQPMPGAHIDGREIVLDLPSGRERYPRADLALVGDHNLENAMASYLAARLAGVEPSAIHQGVAGFRPLSHRLEPVAEIAGIRYFDDSKATNVAAVAASMANFPRKFVLIAGGVDKGGSYQPVFEAIAGQCRGLVLIGEAAPLLAKAAKMARVACPVVHSASMSVAVAAAAKLAKPGQAVVLSPACSSYDMFASFEERGRAFCAAVRALAESAS